MAETIAPAAATGPSRRFCVAPMMDVTDRHCRYFLRLLSRHALLYTEMVTTGALLHGDIDRHLRFDPAERPLALQLGGSEPADLARCARLAERYGYDEINLNCGCPSERVQRGAFGACLMAEPELVADCLRAMQDAAPATPVTVKHRIGLDQDEDYGFVARFVGTLAGAGCRTFIVHARNAVLKGLSPKENREVPPLRYAVVHRLKREHPDLEIVLNGGLAQWSAIERELTLVDGVMLGREIWHNPYFLAQVDARLFARSEPPRSRAEVVQSLAPYARREIGAGALLRHISRHLLGLYQGMPRARLWRRMLSDSRALARNDPTVLLEALAAVDLDSAPARDAA